MTTITNQTKLIQCNKCGVNVFEKSDEEIYTEPMFLDASEQEVCDECFANSQLLNRAQYTTFATSSEYKSIIKTLSEFYEKNATTVS